MLIQPKDVGVKSAVGEVTLSYNQLAKIWFAIEQSRDSTSRLLLHQSLMLYGARNSEMRLAVKSEFNREERTWIVPAEKSKTNIIIRRSIFDAVDGYVSGITASARHRLNTSVLEGMNNKIKVIKRMAYGYRDNDYFFLKIKAAFPGKTR